MRNITPTPRALGQKLGQQLAEWRKPLDDDPAVDEAVVRMLRSLDRYLQRPQEPEEFSRAAAS
jgi:hypothetical protein